MSDCDVQEVLAICEVEFFEGGGLNELGWQGKISKGCKSVNGIDADAGGGTHASGQCDLRTLAGIVDLVKKLGVTAVFSEPQFSPRPAEALARETGVHVYQVDPEGRTLSAGMYEDLMRANTAVFAQALGNSSATTSSSGGGGGG